MRILFFKATVSLQGGDLFDAIASDIKYTETVARDMVTDLANALQVRFLLYEVQYKRTV